MKRFSRLPIQALRAVAFPAAVLLSLTVVSCSSERPQTDGQTVLDVIHARTSIRAYRECPVGADTVEMLLRAAMAAPTASNRQPWAFVVVDDRNLLQQLADSLPFARMAARAPLAVVVCGNAENDWWVQDAAAATENLLLAAQAVGLGAVWTGVYPRSERVQAVRRILRMPHRLVPLNVIPIGYPAETPAPKQKWDPAKVFRNRWTE